MLIMQGVVTELLVGAGLGFAVSSFTGKATAKQAAFQVLSSSIVFAKRRHDKHQH